MFLKKIPFQNIQIEPGGVLLTADSTSQLEQEGIFNPAVAGDILLYRAAGPNNFSRILAAQLSYNSLRNDCNATRLNQVILKPETSYELMSDGSGGVEDPRITQLADGNKVMFYTAFGLQPHTHIQAPSIAVAVSNNGLSWQRLGPVTFSLLKWHGQSFDFNKVPNKDAVLFSRKINGRYAMYHRPMFSQAEADKLQVPCRGIWYAEADSLTGPWGNHALVTGPNNSWETNGVGAGVPPILIKNSWLHIYHGFIYDGHHKHYNAGVFMTPKNHPQKISWRKAEPILEPIVFNENYNVDKHIVFSTAAWRSPEGHILIFWGREDRMIMWGYLKIATKQPNFLAKLELPA